MKNKVLSAILFLLIGGVAGWGIENYRNNKRVAAPITLSTNSEDNFFDKFFNEDFFKRSRDPFAEMKRMEKEMFDQFGSPSLGQNSFQNWYQRKFGGDVAEMKQREDDQFVYYEVELKGQQPKKFDVKVKDGQVNISASAETVDEKPNTRTYASTSFQRSFPVPQNVDANKYEVNQSEGKIVIKFPKLK